MFSAYLVHCCAAAMWSLDLALASKRTTQQLQKKNKTLWRVNEGKKQMVLINGVPLNSLWSYSSRIKNTTWHLLPWDWNTCTATQVFKWGCFFLLLLWFPVILTILFLAALVKFIFHQKMRAEWSLCILVCCHGLAFILGLFLHRVVFFLF